MSRWCLQRNPHANQAKQPPRSLKVSMTDGYEFHHFRGALRCNKTMCIMQRSELALTLHGAEILLIRKAANRMKKKNQNFDATNFDMVLEIAD